MNARSVGTVGGAALAAAVFAAPLPAQRMDPGITLAPSKRELFVISAGGASVTAVAAGLTGFMIDQHLCYVHHPGTDRGVFGPCGFAIGAWTPIGWYGGSVGGATAFGAMIARRRGCPIKAAVWRSLGGAVIGTVPGVLAVSPPSAHSPLRSMLILGTPVLAGVGASLAVVRCTKP